ncbi:uncharacterized protein [Lolium perenne]|uniref:uncharacterized protein isoform X3 n=1 Tax=Lolium perenne TaxID=4522 RepID=UPI0021F5741B|nr:uncharacterized protein LOC127349362 isoform X3 [Lolium perenne]
MADLLTIYLHYEDGNKEAKILQRSMMRRHVSYYDLILMTEEVGFHAVDFLYYSKKDPQGNAYLVHIDDQSIAIKMLSDPDIGKTVHLYVSKEKASDDIAPPHNRNDFAPSNHTNESALLQDGAEGAGQLIVRRPQRQLRRSKRLNVINQRDDEDQGGDEDEDFNNGEQYTAPGDESQALEDNEDRVDNQVHKEVVKRKGTSLPVVWNMPKGQRIVVTCNEEGQPIGEEGAILGKFLGTIARNGGFCPLNINDWRDLKKNSREETILDCVKTKFVYPRSCEKWILKTIGRDWRKFKSCLKKAIFNPAMKKNPDIKRKALYKLCPDDVDSDQWRGLIKFWKSKKGRALAEKNVISRSLVKNTHNAGTKSYARWGEDIRQADPEKKRPHRSTVYLATHKKKDAPENKEKNDRLDRLEDLIAQRPELGQNVNGRVAWEGDALREVLGEEKTGQVHGMGLLPTPKQVYGRTPRYLKNINMTTTDEPACEGEHDVWGEIAMLKEHIRRLEDRNNKEGHGNEIEEEENLRSNNNVISRLPVLHGKTKRVQCSGPVEANSSMQHGRTQDNLLLSREKDGEHDNSNQLLIQQNLSLPQDPVSGSMPEVRETVDLIDESFATLNQQRIGNKRGSSVPSKPSKRRHTSSLKIRKKD